MLKKNINCIQYFLKAITYNSTTWDDSGFKKPGFLAFPAPWPRQHNEDYFTMLENRDDQLYRVYKSIKHLLE